MAIVRQTIVYDGPGGPFEGVIAYDDEVETARPGVMIVPNVLGQKESDNVTAENLAKLGYVGFAATSSGRASAPRFRVRQSGAIYERAQRRPRVAPRPAAGIARRAQGIRVRRSGADRGLWLLLRRQVRARHGARAGSTCSAWSASTASTTGPITTASRRSRPRCSSATAGKTRSRPPDAMVALGKELTEGRPTGRSTLMAHAGHAFTDVESEGPAARSRPGVGYDEKADRRSWEAAQDFLAELFG